MTVHPKGHCPRRAAAVWWRNEPFPPPCPLAVLFVLLDGAARATTYTPEQIAAESAKANAFFERVFNESVARSPQMESQLGIRKNQDKVGR